MTRWQLIVRSLWHHRAIHVAVMLAVASATAVLTGALVVGDSVRGSLRHVTLDRLGRIDFALLANRFFDEQIAARLESQPEFQPEFEAAVPACILPRVSISMTAADVIARAGGVMLVGADDRFWALGAEDGRPAVLPGDHQIVINEPLAAELGARVGDRLTLRLPEAKAVPADSALGRKTDRVSSVAGLELVAVVPARGLGRFHIQPTQQVPKTAFVDLRTLQNALSQTGQVNAILVSAAGRPAPSQETNEAQVHQAADRLQSILQPSLADYGISVSRNRRVFRDPAETAAEEKVVWDYYHVTTDRLIWEPAAAQAARKALAEWHAVEVFTYLANEIVNLDWRDEGGRASVPYSTVTAIELGKLFPDIPPPQATADGQLPPLVLNSWTAHQLDARLGDRIALKYFEPETVHGAPTEKSCVFRLQAIVPLVEPTKPYTRRSPAQFSEPPGIANDPDLTPLVEGLTDQQSVDDWDPPFPFDRRKIQPPDEDYWDNHRTTPKAFISLAEGRRLWSSRFGQLTSFRVPATAGLSLDAVRARLLAALRDRQTELGFRFVPLKYQGLQAAQGTTAFEQLFLGFSFFLIFSALSLVALLLLLCVEMRASEWGTLRAVGWNAGAVSSTVFSELVLVAAAGSGLGMLGGLLYAELMLTALRTVWLNAVVTPFLRLYPTPWGLGVGLVSSLGLTAAIAAYVLLRLRKLSPVSLLAGRFAESTFARRVHSWPLWSAAACTGAAIVLAVMGMRFTGEAQAGVFFGCGSMMLGAALLVAWRALTGNSWRPSQPRLGLYQLAWQAAARNPGRSALTVGLMASACFLIVAIAAFRLAPSAAGTGRFDLVGRSDRPLFADLNDPKERTKLWGAEADKLDGLYVSSLRLVAGDDASCRNLYRPAQPQLWGLPRDVIQQWGQPPTRFQFANVGRIGGKIPENPWQVLLEPTAGDEVPVVLDKNTAAYSLHLSGGVGTTFDIEYEGGRRVRFRVAGLLANSILQGSLLVAEPQLTKLFPESAGYQYLLIDSGRADVDAVRRLLEDRFSDEGLDLQPANQVLADLMAVQNTYLSTFQSLGVLGLLFGTFGLATIQVRNVLQRRGELALLRAVGFRSTRIAALIVGETAILLLLGLGVGLAAAIVAIAPHLVLRTADIPLAALTATLGLIFVVGVLSSLFAVRMAVHLPVLSTLRGD